MAATGEYAATDVRRLLKRQPKDRLSLRHRIVRRTVGLVVPSAHVPEESNLLLNPEHKAFGRLSVTRERVFAYPPVAAI
jgi:RES domain-containing protein